MNVARDALSTIMATMIVRVVGIATLFMSRGLLGPEKSGVWALVQVCLSYILVAHSGVVTGAEREIPYCRGKNDRIREDDVRGQMFATALVEAVLASILFLLFLALFGDRYREELRLGLFFIPCYVILMRLVECWIISWRGIQQFVPLARAQVILAVIDFMLLFLVYRWSLTGQYIAFGLGLAVRLVLLSTVTRRAEFFTLQWKFRWSMAKPLFQVGFPLVANNLLWLVFSSVDSLVVAKRMGVIALGYYSIVASASRAAGEVPVALSTVLYSHLMGGFGSNEDLRELGRKVAIYLRFSVFFLAPVVIAGVFFGIPFIIRQFLPKFLPAVSPLKVMVFSSLFLALANIPSQVFIALRKTSRLTVVTVMACLLSGGAVWVFAPRGLLAVAWAMAVAQVLFFSGLTLAALVRTLGGRAALRTYAELIVAMAWLALTIFLLDLCLPDPGVLAWEADLLRAGAGVVGTLFFVGVVFWKQNKEMGITDRLWRLWRA